MSRDSQTFLEQILQRAHADKNRPIGEVVNEVIGTPERELQFINEMSPGSPVTHSAEQRLMALEAKMDMAMEILSQQGDPALSDRVQALEATMNLALLVQRSGVDRLKSYGKHPSGVTIEPDDANNVPSGWGLRRDEEEDQPKAVIPPGYEFPSEDLHEVRLQYAQAIGTIEALTNKLNSYGSNWRSLMVNPGDAVRYAVALSPLVAMFTDEVKPQLDLVGNQVTVSRAMAETIVAFGDSSTAQWVASHEFLTWALAQLETLNNVGDETARVHLANLVASGLVEQTANPIPVFHPLADGDDLGQSPSNVNLSQTERPCTHASYSFKSEEPICTYCGAVVWETYRSLL